MFIRLLCGLTAVFLNNEDTTILLTFDSKVGDEGKKLRLKKVLQKYNLVIVLSIYKLMVLKLMYQNGNNFTEVCIKNIY